MIVFNPPPAQVAPVSIHPMQLCSIGQDINSQSGVPTSATWPSANRAIYYPFYLGNPAIVRKLWWMNGTAVSGNADIGVFTEGGVRLVSAGSTAQSGTSALQEVDVTDTYLAPGTYYIGVVLSNTTGTMFRWNPSLAALRMTGVAQEASALPLPSTATFAAMSTAYLPYAGAMLRTLAA